MPLELSRLQWEEANQAVERARRDPDRYRRLSGQVDLVVSELRRRVGQTFTLDDLDRAYNGADDWARHLLIDADPEGPVPETGLVADAAFHAYAHGARDYGP